MQLQYLFLNSRFKICDFNYNTKIMFYFPIKSKFFYFFYYIYLSSSDWKYYQT